MKCVLKVESNDKTKVLDSALCSIEQKQRGNYIYLWYDTMSIAKEDQRSLSDAGLKSEILKGWEVDGFVSIYK